MSVLKSAKPIILTKETNKEKEMEKEEKDQIDIKKRGGFHERE
jgi:hypothetical protein